MLPVDFLLMVNSIRGWWPYITYRLRHIFE